MSRLADTLNVERKKINDLTLVMVKFNNKLCSQSALSEIPDRPYSFANKRSTMVKNNNLLTLYARGHFEDSKKFEIVLMTFFVEKLENFL